MLIPYRRYQRQPPVREARKVFIVCEGRKREYQYFQYFQQMDSRIDIRLRENHPHEDNSPLGLFEIACGIATEDYDELWLVFDRDIDLYDSRRPQIEQIRRECNSNASWEAAVSNPCFEVWLYYHFFDVMPANGDVSVCDTWRRALQNALPGGFDSRRHPLRIRHAVLNSELHHLEDGLGEPNVGSTQVSRLARSIIPLVNDALDRREAELRGAPP